MEFILLGIFFLLVYAMYYFLVISRKNKVKKYHQSIEVQYLTTRYQLDLKKVPVKTLANQLALTNAAIISLTAFLASMLDGVIFQLIGGFFLLILFILIGYHMMGKYYQKKLGKKEKR